MNYLFVYGTLLSAYQHSMHQVIAQHGKLLGEGHFQGRLYRISYYPGMVPSAHPSDQVWGEVYALQDAEIVFEYLDDYEGYDPANESMSDYIRREVTIDLTQDQTLQAWTYLYNQPVAALEWIESGNFLKG
ncbi:MAG: gamma-glutamylcyclotransferase family protein [Spirosomataceae bacterium]